MCVPSKLKFCRGGLCGVFLCYHIKVFTWTSNLLHPSFFCHANNYLNRIFGVLTLQWFYKLRQCIVGKCMPKRWKLHEIILLFFYLFLLQQTNIRPVLLQFHFTVTSTFSMLLIRHPFNFSTVIEWKMQITVEGAGLFPSFYFCCTEVFGSL